METPLTDFGAKIGGARKDIRGNMNRDDILRMTPEERLKLVKKDVVWPVPDYEAMVKEQGYSQRGVAMVKMIRDCFPATASFDPRASEEKCTKGAELYVAMLNAAKSITEKGKTETEIGAAFRAEPEAKEFFYDASFSEPLVSWRSPELIVKPAKRFGEVIDGAFNGSRDIGSNIASVMRCVAGGKLDYKAAKSLRVNPQWPEATSKIDTWLRKEWIACKPVEGGWGIMSNGEKIREGSRFYNGTLKPLGLQEMATKIFESEEQAKAQLLKIGEQKFAGKSLELKAKREKIMEKALGRAVGGESRIIDRIGPDHRENANVSGSDYLQTFGMRGGEYGLWVNQEERLSVTNKGYDAFYDLAEVFKLTPEAASLGGTLAIAFGARGRGGWAAATYNPGRRVINLTKPSGEGCLGHEWGHALDHYLGGKAVEAGILDRVKDPKQASYLSNSILKPVAAGKPETPETKFLREFHSAMESIWTNTGPVTKAEVVEHSKERRGANLRNLMITINNISCRLRENPERQAQVKALTGIILKTQPGHEIEDIAQSIDRLMQIPEYSTGHARNEIARYHHAAALSIAKNAENIALPDDWTGPSKVRKTRYFEQVTALDAERKSPYWAEPEEMFARAFESVLEDTLTEKGRSNYFLISSTTGQAYPHGIERTKLKQSFGPLIERLHEFLPVLAPRIPVHVEKTRFQEAENKPEPAINSMPTMQRPALPDLISKTFAGQQIDLF